MEATFRVQGLGPPKIRAFGGTPVIRIPEH